MPFGKANSSKIFCHWVSNWCAAFKSHFSKVANFHFVLESYVDDIFGGAGTFEQALDLKNRLTSIGFLTTTVMNPIKGKGPAQCLVILGLEYDAIRRHVKLPLEKQQKYLEKLRAVMSKRRVESKQLEKLLGYLGFAS